MNPEMTSSSEKQQVEKLKRIVDRQAEDEALWFNARNAYIQQELRRLHEAIEVAAELLPATQQSGDGLEAELRNALVWALGWIEYSNEVPISDDEAEDHRVYLAASALVEHRRASGGGGE